ncbi:L-piperidine-6-carboxylate dehydrogenase [Candidatus Uabimicrobium amorphum]|uniref:aldehyde dehydrogenase (NAD(+)) n=1 Tax=Uabimicrobium amorphum TaxID=2596890 RepID=A0A5S9IIU4_UABAM|nr:aldehyde dehydrogenase family protein [Candidatus Uabimicrobium amorphum]BBM82669.1 aldehyde dehydrogenase [Candidatus Uabimicrobium amorphum]
MSIDTAKVLENLGIQSQNYGAFNGEWFGSGEVLESISPIDGKKIATVVQATTEEYEKVYSEAEKAFKEWRMVPGPKRGEIVRQIGEGLRAHKDDLGALVTLEMGKIWAEGKGEVQEMIDIADFAVGLSRQMYGRTMHSERPLHRMYEQWHPLGVIGIISAFNFPVAVWSWNAMIAAVCGDTMIWKPSPKTPLTAIACQKIAAKVFVDNGLSPAVMSLVIGETETVGEKMIHDKRLPLISATGSTRMGKRVGEVVGGRLGRTILELGGNNAIIVSNNSDMKMVTRAILFGAVGTAGQRCTSTRRVFIHEDIYDELKEKLVSAYQQVSIGNPLDEGTLMGPLIDNLAVQSMQDAITEAKSQGGTVLCGGEVLQEDFPCGNYVKPCIIEMPNQSQIVQDETFAPILYLLKFNNIEEALHSHNAVPQGLSSAMFTTNVLEAETFLSHMGSDCGIANINIGTSGAEIGGAFGGEKETGGGREAGSDSWKAYMRRQTNTINWSKELPLAQGIKFGD